MVRATTSSHLGMEVMNMWTGPVVRISPTEIHLADPDNYEKVYYVGSKAPSKAPYFYDSFGLNTAAFGTASNELHRIRRAVINPVFSRKAVLELESIVQEKTAKLVKRMNGLLAEKQPVDLHHGYRALSVDVISDYAFDNDSKQLDSPTFAASFYEMAGDLLVRGWILQAFPFLLPLSKMVTLRMAKKMSKALYLWFVFRAVSIYRYASVDR
jgi:cytochrome P450